MGELRRFGIGALIFSFVSAHAAPPPRFSDVSRKKLRDSVALFNRSKSFDEFLEKTKFSFSEQQFRFLSEKMKASVGHLPHLEMNGNDGYVINSGGMNLRVRYVSIPEGTLSVNHHTLYLGKNADPAEVWEKVAAALPQSGSHALFKFILPDAQAMEPVEIMLVIVGAVVGLWYIVTGDPCKDVIEPFNDCRFAVRQFKNLKSAFPNWPWKGSDADRLAAIKTDGIGLAVANKQTKPHHCDSTDCRIRWARIMAGQCTPTWASDAVSSARSVLGESVGPLIEPENRYIRTSVLFDNRLSRKFAPGVVCTDYKGLQTCLKELTEDLHGVCVHPENDVPHYNKAMGLPPANATH